MSNVPVQAALEGFNNQIIITIADLTETTSGTAQTILCGVIPKDSYVNRVAYYLTEEFSGFNEEYKNTWTKENHQNFLSNHPEIKDTVYSQIGQGDLVATKFARTMNYQGKDVKIDVLHLKRFENGKIAEIIEYSDTKELE